MRKLLFLLTALTLIFIAAVFIAWMRFSRFLAGPAAHNRTEKVVTIPPDATVGQVVQELASEGIVDRADLMRLYVDHFAKDLAVHPGEYQLSSALSPVELLRRISSGKVITYTVTIPPGADAIDIAKALAKLKLGDEQKLIETAYDRKTAEALGVPSPSLEGYLFPDTYELPRNLSPAALLGQLVQRYRQIVLDGVLKSARAHNLSENELITLASLIEKEGVIPNERRLYAALLYNRLMAKMPLESPATVLYGLRRQGIDPAEATNKQVEHAWNTEFNFGLPPTPICSPGLASIVAAAEPAQSRAMYMVKRSDNTHVFCEDDECYRAAQKEWQPDMVPKKKRKKHRERELEP